ncbi:MAG: hypothetical protein ABFD49_12095 [Armatimonadota bacterium]|nr:hypothetical protein [bacterium]
MAHAATVVKQRFSETAHRAREKADKAAEKIMEQRRIVDSAMSVPEKISPRVFFGLSLGSIILSLGLFAAKRKDDAVFVGHWAPTFLLLGLFSRLVSSKQKY